MLTFSQQLLQQHVNRGLKRLARMKGREAPSDLELRENIVKRMYIPVTGPGAHSPQKRYNRKGTAVSAASTETNEGIDLHTSSKSNGNEAIGGKNKLKGHKATGKLNSPPFVPLRILTNPYNYRYKQQQQQLRHCYCGSSSWFWYRHLSSRY